MKVLIPQKIDPPYLRAELISRPQLSQRILGNLDRKVSLVSAPAGYGKTSLAFEISGQSEVLSCWYHLDARDGHLETFYDYICETLSRTLPSFKAHLPKPSPDETAWGLAGLISSTLYNHVSEPILLILDNFHEIDSCEPISRFVDALITYIPPTCHLLILSRTSTDLNLARLIAQQDLNLITRQDLKLSLDEAHCIADNFTINKLTEINDLYHKVDGWLAGFTLLASQYKQKPVSLSPDKLVRDYLKAEFFDNLDPLEQRFALYASVIAPFTPQDLNEAFGQDLYGLIEHFVNRYQMLYELGQGAHTHILYAFTPLVQNFLTDYLEHHEPELWRDLNLRFGERFWIEGHFEGLEFLAKAKRYDLIVEKLASLKLQLLETGDWRKLGPWLQDIPEATLRNQGELLTILAETEVMSQPAEALHHYQLALEKQTLASQTQAKALVGRLRAMFKLQHFKQVIAESALALAELNKISCKRELAQAHSLVASSQLMLGNYTDAKRNFDQVSRIAAEVQDDYLSSLAARGLAAHAEHVGDVHQAIELDRQVLAYWEERGNKFEVSALLNNLAANHYDLGDLETALQYGLRALSMREELEAIGRFALLCCTLGDIYRAGWQFEEARQYYELALRRSQTKPFAHGYALQGLAALALEQKNLEEASEQAKQTLEVAKENGLQLLEGLAHLRLGQVSRHRQTNKLATQHFDLAIDLFSEMGAHRELGLAHLIKSQREADKQAALKHRQEVERIETELGYSLRRAIPTARLKISEANQTQLSLLTLGRLEFQLNNTVVTIKAWNGRKPRDIVLFLASCYHGASRDQIIDTLWEEERGTNLEQQFSIALSRARRALSQERVIVRNDQLYTFAEDVYLKEDARLIETTSPDAPDDTIKAALEYYQGDYLPGYYDNWVETRREQLRTKALLLFGTALERLDEQSMHEAPDLAAKALEIDPCHETSHRQLIRYYLKHQGSASARRQYLQYLEALKEMNVEPNPTIAALLEA